MQAAALKRQSAVAGVSFAPPTNSLYSLLRAPNVLVVLSIAIRPFFSPLCKPFVILLGPLDPRCHKAPCCWELLALLQGCRVFLSSPCQQYRVTWALLLPPLFPSYSAEIKATRSTPSIFHLQKR